MRRLTWDDFAGAAGRSYAVEADGSALAFTLDRVQPLSSSGEAAQAFRLEFLGPPDPVLPQAIYCFSDGDGEPFEIFVVPVGREAGGIRYEAIFN